MTQFNSASDADNVSGLLVSFAQSQLASVDREIIYESLIIEQLVCAFFWGAEAQLRKQSQPDHEQCQLDLLTVITDACNAGEFQAIELINSIEELASKYYFFENIALQGEAAADKWLGCEDVDDDALRDLIEKYKNVTMSELGIEGLSEKFAVQQNDLYVSVDRSVAKIRQRAIVILLLLIGTGVTTALIVQRFYS